MAPKPKPSVPPNSSQHSKTHRSGGKNTYQCQPHDYCPRPDFHDKLQVGAKLTFRRREWLHKNLRPYANSHPSKDAADNCLNTSFAFFKGQGSHNRGLQVAIGSPDGPVVSAVRTAFHELVDDISCLPWKPFEHDPDKAIQMFFVDERCFVEDEGRFFAAKVVDVDRDWGEWGHYLVHFRGLRNQNRWCSGELVWKDNFQDTFSALDNNHQELMELDRENELEKSRVQREKEAERERKRLVKEAEKERRRQAQEAKKQHKLEEQRLKREARQEQREAMARERVLREEKKRRDREKREAEAAAEREMDLERKGIMSREPVIGTDRGIRANSTSFESATPESPTYQAALAQAQRAGLDRPELAAYLACGVPRNYAGGAVIGRGDWPEDAYNDARFRAKLLTQSRCAAKETLEARCAAGERPVLFDESFNWHSELDSREPRDCCVTVDRICTRVRAERDNRIEQKKREFISEFRKKKLGNEDELVIRLAEHEKALLDQSRFKARIGVGDSFRSHLRPVDELSELFRDANDRGRECNILDCCEAPDILNAITELAKSRKLREVNILQHGSNWDMKTMRMYTPLLTTPGTWTRWHVDVNGTCNHSFAGQVDQRGHAAGKKLWLFVSRDHFKDDLTFEEFVELPAGEAGWCVIEAGQTLFVPAKFYHFVVAVTPYVGVGGYWSTLSSLPGDLFRWICNPDVHNVDRSRIMHVLKSVIGFIKDGLKPHQDVLAQCIRTGSSPTAQSLADLDRWAQRSFMATFADGWEQWQLDNPHCVKFMTVQLGEQLRRLRAETCNFNELRLQLSHCKKID